MRKLMNFGGWSMALAVLLVASGCKKTEIEAKAAMVASDTPTAPKVIATLEQQASRFGFAQYLPADTEGYFGTLNLPAHLAALKDTNCYQDLTAFLDDKTPVPDPASAKQEAKPKAFEKLLGSDFFISLGKGSAAAMHSLQPLMMLYNEKTYRDLMTGVTSGSKPGNTVKDSALKMILGDPEFMQRVTEALTGAQLPPIMIGVRTDKPDEVLNTLLPEELMAQLTKNATQSQALTSTVKGKFTIIETKSRSLFTDELKKQTIEGLPPEAAAALPFIDKAWAVLQAKSFTLTRGSAEGFAIIMLGTERPKLDFVSDPHASLVSRPEFEVIAPHAAKNLVAITFVEGTTLQALQSPERLQPMARGVLAALKQSPVFGGMAKVLEPKVAALAPLERQMYDSPMTTAIGAMWWDKGLHIELEGGLSAKGLESKPLKFASLLEDKDVVLGLNYHGDPKASALMRSYVEGWADVLHTAAKELVNANLFGESGKKIAPWVDLELIPQLVAFYNGSKALYGKGLGNEHAWLMDLGGRMPPLPGMAAPDPKNETKMMRIVGMYEVADRRVIGDGWATMEASLTALGKAFPMLAGQKLPEPESTNASGVTSYFYTLPGASDDLLPCASVNDKIFMLGTSKNQQQSIAKRLLLAEPGSGKPTMLWRVSFPNLRAALKNFSPVAPAPTSADGMKSATKWMAPLGEMRGRMSIDAGRVQNSINWVMKDTVKFD